MAAQECGDTLGGPFGGDVSHLDSSHLLELEMRDVMSEPGARPPAGDGTGIFLCIRNQVVQGLEGRIILDRDPNRGGLEQVDGLQLIGLVACVCPGQGLQHDVRNIDAGDEISVRFLFDHICPSHGSASSGLVLDHDLDTQSLLETRLLSARFQIRLPAGPERNQIGVTPARINVRQGRSGKSKNQRQSLQ